MDVTAVGHWLLVLGCFLKPAVNEVDGLQVPLSSRAHTSVAASSALLLCGCEKKARDHLGSLRRLPLQHEVWGIDLTCDGVGPKLRDFAANGGSDQTVSRAGDVEQWCGGGGELCSDVHPGYGS